MSFGRAPARRGPTSLVLPVVAVLLLSAFGLPVGGQSITPGYACLMGDTAASDNAWNGTALGALSTNRVVYFDTDANSVINAYDPLFVDRDADLFVSALDVRWSDEVVGEAGSRVSSNDSGVGYGLLVVPSLRIRYLDQDLSGFRSSGEPVLMDVTFPGFLSEGDRYLAPNGSAGSRVGAMGTADTSSNPLTNLTGRLAYMDWDNDNASDADEAVIWDTDNSSSVSPGDLCLSHVVAPVSRSPTPTPSQSNPYSGGWQEFITLTNPGTGACERSEPIGVRLNNIYLYVDPNGTWTSDQGGRGTVNASTGEVTTLVPATFVEGCEPTVPVGHCSSLTFCSGNRTDGDARWTWEWVRQSPSSTRGEDNPVPYWGEWQLYVTPLSGAQCITQSEGAIGPEGRYAGNFLIFSDGSWVFGPGAHGALTDSGEVTFVVTCAGATGTDAGTCTSLDACSGAWRLNSANFGTWRFVRQGSQPTPPPPATPPEEQQPGEFEKNGSHFQGVYVAFDVDTSGGLLTNHTVQGIAFFDRIEIPCPCTTEDILNGQGQPVGLFVRGEGAYLALKDHPTGTINFGARSDVFAEFLLDASATVTISDRRLDLIASGQSAVLSVAAPDPETTPGLGVFEDIEGSHVQASGSGNFFLTKPPNQREFFVANDETVTEAIVAGSLAGRVQLLKTAFGNEPQILTYDNLTIEFSQPRALDYEIRVEAELAGGRSFLLEFPLDAFPAEGLTIAWRTEVSPGVFELQTMTLSGGFRDALLVEAGEGGEYWIERTPEGFQIVLAVPSFSIQLFQVFGIPPEAAPIFAYLVVFGFLFLGVAVMGVAMGKSRKIRWKPPREQIRSVLGQQIGMLPAADSGSRRS